jgi:hypothetical protein
MIVVTCISWLIVVMLLVEMKCRDHAEFCKKIEIAIHRGQTDTGISLSRQTVDVVGVQVTLSLANHLQQEFALRGYALALGAKHLQRLVV